MKKKRNKVGHRALLIPKEQEKLITEEERQDYSRVICVTEPTTLKDLLHIAEMIELEEESYAILQR